MQFKEEETVSCIYLQFFGFDIFGFDIFGLYSKDIKIYIWWKMAYFVQVDIFTFSVVFPVRSKVELLFYF